jgi:hypothetical protein
VCGARRTGASRRGLRRRPGAGRWRHARPPPRPGPGRRRAAVERPAGLLLGMLLDQQIPMEKAFRARTCC